MTQGPIIIRLRSSRRLCVFLTLLYSLAALSVWAPVWPGWLPLLLDGVIAFSLRQSTRPSGVAALRLDAGAQLAIADAAGQWQTCTVLPDSAVLPFLIVLRLRVIGNAAGEARSSTRRPVRSLVLPADALIDASQFRTLRVWLRWRAGLSGARNA
jgi:hypothetical protein